MLGRCTVVHDRGKRGSGRYVYIGRGRGSNLGNPFPLGKRTPQMEAALRELEGDAALGEAAHTLMLELRDPERVLVRGEAIVLFETLLRLHCREQRGLFYPLFDLARNLANGEDLDLGCWCTPQPCHGDVIARAALGYARRLVAARQAALAEA